ncbi:hypothetical protein MHU86_25864 [Fragilaria crotonensis]|nr:hypothetical protein MHU86_25864 [Fragilaria crotonensis]
MATIEQLNQFGDTSSGSSSDSDESSEELLPQEPTRPKLKLTLRLSADHDDKPSHPTPDPAKSKEELAGAEEVGSVFVKSERAKGLEHDSIVVNAMVVDDDEELDDMTVLAEPVSSSAMSAGARVSHTKKRLSVRPIKMPAIASPGLLLPNATTTAALFDHHMVMAGYSLETRIENPQRGSSTKREVGDLFDTDIQLNKNFPKLVPPELIADSTDGEPKLIQLLKKGLRDPKSGETRKRRFDDMIPISLKIDYPSDYVKKRKEYITLVMERETAIIEAQEAELEDRHPCEIPPIPDPPSPPVLEENQQGLDLKNTHPFYPPMNETFVKHLDPNCFHSGEGRYIGLSSNSISDPHFVGAHAVGIQNLSVTAGTGLATTQTGSTSAGSASLASTVYGDKSKSDTKTVSINEERDKDNVKQEMDQCDAPKVKSAIKKKKSASPSPASSQSGSAAELKRIMEAETAETEAMRVCIIRAGVYASRAGRHGQSFLGPDGNTYQDVSKTFASYAGVKPCSRCKNNKQGAYHCRLRRKHKDLDYDGGNSPSILAPLFNEALESLILKPSK